VTHRDVKPDNILILNGHAKIADFGLAREQELVMASMSFAGTPAYMAPEIWGGSGGPASDQYSLAFVYVELRQGRAPLKPAPMADMMFAHLEGHFDFAENIPEPERAVLRTAMHKSPEERFPTCTAFTEALAESLGFQVYRKASPHGSSIAFPSISDVVAQPGTQTISPTDSGRDTVLPGSRKPAPATKPKRDTHGPSSTPSVVMKGLPRRKPPTAKPIIAAAAFLGLLLAAGVLIYFATNSNTPSPVVETTQPQGLTGIPTVQDPPKVTPGSTEPVLPANAKAAPLAKILDLADGRRMYDVIVIPAGKENVRFRFFAPSGSVSIKPFYIMECKVWVKLYPEADRIAQEERNPNEPAMGMTALQAQAFAEKVFGGSLPTPKEWDIAAGYYSQEGRTGPYLPGAQIQINRKAPEAVNRDQADGKDVTPQGLRDMAGNGREFTNAIFGAPNVELNSQNVKDDTLVVLRGRNFTLATPLDYAIMKTQQEQPQTQFAQVGSRYTGFRVVIRLP